MAVLLAAPIALPPSVAGDGRSLVLRVGTPMEMWTRNILPLYMQDLPTWDILSRVHETPIHIGADGSILAYVAKGIDRNEDQAFGFPEYDAWEEQANASTPLTVDVYYDLNGVRWHDGAQMTAWDFLFSYHLESMNPRVNEAFRVLYCDPYPISSYESCGRHLGVRLLDTDQDPTNGYQKNWEGEGAMQGTAGLRIALRFTLAAPSAHFYERALAPRLLPMHVWSRTGGGRHADFGCAIWIPPDEANSKGVPECGNADPMAWGRGISAAETVPDSRPYSFATASQWNPGDAAVVGSGPFVFRSWNPGVETSLGRNDDYYTGVDTRGTAEPGDDIVVDPRLSATMRKPTIKGIRYTVYKTPQLGVFALQNSEIDTYRWYFEPEFVPDLVKVPEISVVGNPGMSFTYMTYNFGREPWGYRNGDASQGDVGIVLRQAFSHIVDKDSIVENELGGFGVVASGMISPANSFWYNPGLPKPTFDPSVANLILDSPEARAVNISSDPPGRCSRDTAAGCRSLGTLGTPPFELLVPETDYVRMRATATIADAMRGIGVNAVSRPISLSDMASRVYAGDFDLFILSWSIGGTDPDFLFSFFHCSNAGSGQNYPRYCSDEFDDLIERSRAEMNRTARRELIFEAQSILARDRPYEVFYHRMLVEAYRQDRFVNWTVQSGSIWNSWSLLRIRPPLPHTLHVRVQAPSALAANGSDYVLVVVTDERGQAVPTAAVTLATTSGLLTIGSVTGASVSGTTDLGGWVRAQFRAPDVAAETAVRITATASQWDFLGPATATATILVFPRGVPFLYVTVDLPLGNVVRPGGTLMMQTGVGDQDRRPVADAQVRVESSDPAIEARPASGTATEMARVSLFASSAVTERQTVNVTILVEREGYAGAGHVVLVLVLPESPREIRCPSGEVVSDLADCPEHLASEPIPWLAVLLIVGPVVAAGAILAARRRRKR